MGTRVGGGALRELRALFDWGTLGNWSDEQLLAHFRDESQDREPALRALIDRYGPMVLGVCLRVLGDRGAAEDAFQSTFLVLVRKADTLRPHPTLAGWLHGVALRVARKERARSARRRSVERRVVPAVRGFEGEVERAELRAIIDEEVGRLPERYRLPVVLCYLEGLRHEEVARRLGCPVGTVESRLSRARERLRGRLIRRGLAPSASAMVLAVGRPEAPAAVGLPAAAARTIRAAAELSAHPVGLMSGLGRRVLRPLAALGPATRAGLVVSAVAAPIGLVALGPSASSPGGQPLRRSSAMIGAAAPRPVRGVPQEPRPEEVQEESARAPAPPEPPKEPAPKPTAVAEPRPEPPEAATKEAPGPTRRSFAYAPPLTGIEIDGRLDDWPPAIPRFPIDKLLFDAPGTTVGPGGLRDANLWTSPDLSAAFSVGYDPKEQLLYLAVIVRDDSLIVGHESHLDTDALEIYLDGSHRGRWIPFPPSNEAYDALDPSTVPAQQYVAIPGKGRIYGKRQASNPILIHGTARDTRTRMAYTRKGDVTTYEWAIQVFDRYPDRPSRLEPGKRIGFDIAVADKDVPATSPGGYNEPADDRTAWIYWGPEWRGVNSLRADSLGELILVK